MKEHTQQKEDRKIISDCSKEEGGINETETMNKIRRINESVRKLSGFITAMDI